MMRCGEMPMEGLRSVIKCTTCIRRNMRPKRGKEYCSFYIGRTTVGLITYQTCHIYPMWANKTLYHLPPFVIFIVFLFRDFVTQRL